MKKSKCVEQVLPFKEQLHAMQKELNPCKYQMNEWSKNHRKERVQVSLVHDAVELANFTCQLRTLLRNLKMLLRIDPLHVQSTV